MKDRLHIRNKGLFLEKLRNSGVVLSIAFLSILSKSTSAENHFIFELQKDSVSCTYKYNFAIATISFGYFNTVN
jgi:hypothetical protein